MLAHRLADLASMPQDGRVFMFGWIDLGE